MSLLDSLTPEQSAAATSYAPNVYVEAGPGSGKTRVLAARILHLIRDRRVTPERIRAFVFTRAAAQELRERVLRELPTAGLRVDVTTFHSHALMLLNNLRSLDGLPPWRVASEVEEATARDELYDRRSGRRLPSHARPTRGMLEEEIREYSARATLPSATVALLLFRLAEVGLTPSWALVPRACDALIERGIACSVDHILVDESQDCATVDVAVSVLRGRAECFVVGDPRQSIMEWRGAGPSSMAPFRATAKEFRLSRTFRFGPEIARLANAIAALFGGEPIVGTNGVAGMVREALDVVSAVADAHTSDVAVLCRTNEDCRRAVADLGVDRAIHVRRDPEGRGAEDADLFAAARQRRLIPVATVHVAKGREWDHVVLAPSMRWPDGTPEDWRVLYVAVTRARVALTVCGLATPAAKVPWRSDAP